MDVPKRSVFQDHLEAWVDDDGAVRVIAVGRDGDALSLSEQETEDFIERLQECLRGMNC